MSDGAALPVMINDSTYKPPGCAPAGVCLDRRFKNLLA
jgi:hypothetical protein